VKVPRLPGTGKPVASDDAVALEGFVVRSHPLLRKAGRNRSLIAGATIIGILVLMAILAPWIERYDPLEQNLQQVLALPSWEHWLSTVSSQPR
jgi:ABC-type dipeptide/oligopeptide/nickel transport system permease subunit